MEISKGTRSIAPQATLSSAIVSKSLHSASYPCSSYIAVILSEPLWLTTDLVIGALEQPTLASIPKVFSGTFSGGDVESNAVDGIRNGKNCSIHIILLGFVPIVICII